jgi:hypothetical protein
MACSSVSATRADRVSHPEPALGTRVLPSECPPRPLRRTCHANNRQKDAWRPAIADRRDLARPSSTMDAANTTMTTQGNRGDETLDILAEMMATPAQARPGRLSRLPKSHLVQLTTTALARIDRDGAEMAREIEIRENLIARLEAIIRGWKS